MKIAYLFCSLTLCASTYCIAELEEHLFEEDCAKEDLGEVDFTDDHFTKEDILKNYISTEQDIPISTPPIPPKKVVPEKNYFSLAEVKAGYFFFQSKDLQEVYDQGGFDIQLSGSFLLWRWLSLYTSVECAQKSGHALNTGAKTSVYLIPLSLGFKGTIPIVKKYFDAYLSAGPRYVFAHQHNHSDFVPKHVSGNNIGMFANFGFLGRLPCQLTFDLFSEYSYAMVHFEGKHSQNVSGHTVQVGGFTFGGGIGYSF